MEILKQKKNYIFPEDCFFFDIETTGLSPRSSYVYLIGYMQMEEGECILTSVFCENYNEEKELMLHLKNNLDRNKTLIHYNGSTFDIPYLNHKFQRHQLNYTLEGIRSIDIYKCLTSYKKYFDTTDLKLKTVEYLSGFLREDTFSGQELATLYEELTGMRRLYEISKKQDAFDRVKAIGSCILLHNSDDLDGLYAVYQKCGFLNNSSFKNPTFELTPFQLIITLPAPLYPIPFEADTGLYYIINGKNATEIAVTLHTGSLKYFYEDYKNYTYLPDEDYALITSVTGGLPKDKKQKATRETAYNKKEGIFLPVSKAYKEYALDSHIFLFGSCYKERHSFVEFQNNLEFLTDYVKYLSK